MNISSLLFLDSSDELFCRFFIAFLGAAMKKVSTPMINEAMTVPMVLDLDILYIIDIFATRKVGISFS